MLRYFTAHQYSIKRRNLLYKRGKVSGNLSKYKLMRNKVTCDLRIAKKSYFQKINPKKSKEFTRPFDSHGRFLHLGSIFVGMHSRITVHTILSTIHSHHLTAEKTSQNRYCSFSVSLIITPDNTTLGVICTIVSRGPFPFILHVNALVIRVC